MTKLIAEIGLNHNGSYKTADEICNFIIQNKIWGAKFQYRNLKRYKITYKSEIGKEIIDTEIQKNYLSPSKIVSLTRKLKSFGIKVGISFFSHKDVDDFKKINFDFYKIPSVVNDNFELIKKLKNKFLIISLGTKTHNEIISLKKNYDKIIKKKYTVLHCVSNYPLIPENTFLSYIDILKKLFKKSFVGYSSHDNNPYIPIISLTKKIDFLERHITTDKMNKGLDHSSSSDFIEFKQINFFCKNLNRIYFSKKKKNYLNQGEIINLQNLGIGYFSNKNIQKDTLIKRSDIQEGYGKSLGLNLDDFINKKLKKKIKIGSLIDESYFRKKKYFGFNERQKLNYQNISLPIRPGDYKQIDNYFGLDNYEFHLSKNDIKNLKISSFDIKFLKNKCFSVHAPDYCDENNILDIFSKNKMIKKKSLKILDKCFMFSKELQKISNKKVHLICSFSKIDDGVDKYEYYSKLSNFINKMLKQYKILLLPQWLPAYAWYFGGSEKINIFSNPEDMKILKKLNINLCLDVSHYLLSCNFNEISPDKFLKKYFRLFKHFHISDAKGFDSEGISLGEGDLKNTKILSKIFSNKKSAFVVETWQGHLNGFKYFIKDLKFILKYL